MCHSEILTQQQHGILWSTPLLPTTHVKYLHGIPWSSMEFDGIFSMEFHGVLGHGVLWSIFHGIPWKKSSRTSSIEVDPESV